MTTLALHIRRLARETRGAEIAEAAAVLPIMFMILIGIFWFGQAFSIYGTITRAAQDGARAAVPPLCTTCSGGNDPAANAYNAVQTAMSSAHLDVNKLQRLATDPPLCPCGATACTGLGVVKCDNSHTNICVQGIQPLAQLSPVSNGPGICGVSVSMRYPFSFSLPFTSLSNQRIWLQAQAQVRAESQ